jgi:hypothetical protein
MVVVMKKSRLASVDVLVTDTLKFFFAIVMSLFYVVEHVVCMIKCYYFTASLPTA